MKTIQRAVVFVLLSIWCFPAMSLARPQAAQAPALPEVVRVTAAPVPAATRGAQPTESTTLAAREKQAQNLQDFKGGEGVYIYGSGVLLVLIIVLLILLI